MNKAIELKHISIWICQACLDGKGKECHTPGCALYLHTVSLPIVPEMYELLKEPEKPKREQIVEDNPEESELPAILRDYSDTDDLIPKPVLEKASERMEDLEGAINNTLKHGTEKPCDPQQCPFEKIAADYNKEPAKPVCSACGGSGKVREKSVNTESYIWQPCPKCSVAEGIKKLMNDLLDGINCISSLNRYSDGSHETRDYKIDEQITKLHNLWVEIQYIIESREANATEA